MLPSSRNKKVTAATIDGYSRNSKYTETFFHHPSRNPHTQLTYESRFSKHPIKTFRVKGKSDFQEHVFESSLHPLPHKHSHFQKATNITGDRKRGVQFATNKATDPITLTVQPPRTPIRQVAPFEASYSYRAQIERQNYLPSTREISRSHRMYHSQIGFSLSARESYKQREVINNSTSMRSTIQYQDSPEMNKRSCFDDLRYNSRK